MNQPLANIIASGGARRGACPTLDAPMQTGDGLLARVRVVGGVLAPVQLATLAQLAAQHGNGLVEITARGNLQVRGLRPEAAPTFARAVAALIEVETGLVINVSPVSGLDPKEIADPTPLARRIREQAAAFAGKLGPKVSVVIDGRGQISLARLKADIRLLALDRNHWAVTLGGGKPQAMDEDGAIAATLALLGALAAIGPEARATDLFSMSYASPTLPSLPPTGVGAGFVVGAKSPLSVELVGGSTSMAIALPFGQIESAALVRLMEATETDDISTLRLAPNHILLIDDAPDRLVQRAAALGFIVDPADPRRHISACIGNQGCASGHIAARQIAARLGPHLPAVQHLHVSGCAKGCAHPRPAALTLVGREDGIGLVIDGRAGDTPRQILDETALTAALAPSRDRR